MHAAVVLPGLQQLGEELCQFALLESASVPAARGQWGEAMVRIEEGLALNDSIGNRAERPLLLALAARLHRWRGRFGAAVQLCSDATELARQVGADWMLSWAQTEQGAALSELGAPDQAIAHLEDGRRIARACHSTGCGRPLPGRTAGPPAGRSARRPSRRPTRRVPCASPAIVASGPSRSPGRVLGVRGS